MPEYIKILVVFLLVINVVTFFVYGMDKAVSDEVQPESQTLRMAHSGNDLAAAGGDRRQCGRVGDETVSNQSPDAKCITVNANNFMGGVSIKN